MEHTENHSVYFYKQIYGKVCFWLMVEPDNAKAREAKEYLQKLQKTMNY